MLSQRSRDLVKEANVIVNARVAVDPDVLAQRVREAIEAACTFRGGRVEFRQTQSLRPARPQPTHRYASAV